MTEYIYVFVAILLLSILINAFQYYKMYRQSHSVPKNTGWFSSIMAKIDGMLSSNGDSKSWSSNRFSFILSTVLSDVIVWGGLAYVIILNGKFPDSITFELVTLYALAKGISGATKVAQYVQEIKTGMQPPPESVKSDEAINTIPEEKI